MNFEGYEVGFWVVYWSVKCKFLSSHCYSHYVRLLLLGPNVVDDAAICDLGALGEFLPVDEKTSVSFLYFP